MPKVFPRIWRYSFALTDIPEPNSDPDQRMMSRDVMVNVLRLPEAQHQTGVLIYVEGLSSFHWSQDGYEYSLIGGRDDTLVSRIGVKFVALGI